MAKVSSTQPLPGVSTAPPTWPQRLHWLLLAVAPSSLMLSVTGYLTTDIAAIPLLWIIPLALYLLTFAIVFARRPLLSHPFLARWQPMAVLVLMLLLLREATEPLLLVLALHVLGFFWLALVCHGELARTRPATAHLTEFYLWLAIGGALGGVFNALIAPQMFTSYAEYPLMIAVAALLKPSLNGFASTTGEESLRRAKIVDCLAPLALALVTAGLIFISRWQGLDSTINVAVVYATPLVLCYALQRRPIRFGLCVAAVFLASALDPGVHGPATYRARSFFGVHRVTMHDGMRRLVHGNTVHGQQFLQLEKRREPLTYYHRTGPIGKLMAALRGDPRLERVGLVGLGAGSLAAYAKRGQHWTFFEIDPVVKHIAVDSGLFTFIPDARKRGADIDIVLGDARLTLEQSDAKFGLLVIDAFGSDAIPWHLLTREALELDRTRLQDNGILAFHISNRFLDLEPVLANQAEELHWQCEVSQDPTTGGIPGKHASTWLFLAASGALPKNLDTTPGRIDPNVRPWTDDYSNLLDVIRWRER